MTAPHADQLIDGYLARLRAAASDLPPATRDELIDDVRSHIAEARARETDETDAAILNILDRLGEPATMVGETRERLGFKAPAPYRTGLLEIAAVVLLPFVWLIGVILLWLSPAWNTRDKIIGTVFSLGGYSTIFILGALFAVGGSSAGSTGSCQAGTDSAGNLMPTACSTGSPLTFVLSAVLLLLPVVMFALPALTSIYLAVRLRWGRRQLATA